MDFIPEMTKHLLAHYPLNETWANLLSAGTLSSILSLETNYVTNRGANSCNLWIAYFAGSGDFKSTPIDNVTIPLFTAVGQHQERCVILPSIASTIEGLIKYFKEHPKNRRGVIMRDELTTLFKEVGGKQYLTEEMETYSLMYDGKIFPRQTMRFESKEMMYVYVNLIGATTPRYLYETMTEKFFFQGTGNRFLYVKHKLPSQANNKKEDLLNKRPNWTQEGLPAELQPFYEVLIELADQPYELIMMDSDAQEATVKFHNEREKLKDQIHETDQDAFKREYLSRDWQKSLKLAQLKAISRKASGTIAREKRMIDIEIEDIEWGQKIVSECYDYFQQIVTEWKGYVRTEERAFSRDTRLATIYLGAIKEYGVISQAKLANVVGNIKRNNEFYEVLGYLIQIGCVELMTDCPEFIRQQGVQWMDQMMIKPNFSKAPQLYKFKQNIPT